MTNDRPMTSAEAHTLIAESQAAREEAKKLRRYIVTAGLAVLLPVLALLATVILGTVLLVRLSDVAEVNKANGEIVKDCTTPGGECFERGQRATGDAVGSINKVTILVARCQAAGRADLEACVGEGLQENP